MVNRKKARNHAVNGNSTVSLSGSQTRTAPKPIQLPSIPLAAVLSFVKETRGTLTWSIQDMVRSLKIGEPEANQIIGILSLQGYVKAALDNQGWLTTTAGEDVSGSKLPRYKLSSVNEALSFLENHIKSINRDRHARFHVADAVAYGDFLLGRSMVQAAEVGVRLVADNEIPEEPASTKPLLEVVK
jgi:hypothetical protein